jgi:hypothetical protein
LAVLTACDIDRNLEVRTFQVETTNKGQLESVGTLIQPYVYTERPDAPGSMSIAAGAITVRETPDNLDQIARVLADLDLSETPAPSFRLQFQLVEANGASESDPVIADVVEELRKALRFEGYSLVGEAQIALQPRTGFGQVIQTAENEYYIDGKFEKVGSGYVLTVGLDGPRSRSPGNATRSFRRNALATSVGIRPNQTLVLGSVLVEDSAVLFAVVRLAEV